MAKERAKTETLVGGFLLLGLLMMAGLIIQFGNITEWVKGKYSVSVDFKEATGVIKGGTVRMLGARIGSVGAEPELMDNSKVRVTLDIEDKFKIPKGSVFQIGQASLIGDKEIVITPPDELSGKSIIAGAQLTGGGASGLEQLQADAEMIAEDARILMKDARTAMIKMDSSLDDIRAVAIRLSESIEIINEGILSEENVANLSRGIANFDKATQSAAQLADDARPLITEARVTLKDTRVAVNEIKATAQNANSAVSKVNPALDRVPQTLASIEKTVDLAGDTIAHFNKEKGALGALINDGETAADTKAFIKNLRKHGILRYKDQETKEGDPRDRMKGRRR